MPGVAVVIANYSILFEVFFFNIVGCFGNVQLLWTTYRKKSTHTKPGILLAINAFYHIICLIGELVNAAFIIRGEHPTRDRCYPLIVVYIFAICQQVFITFVMAVDLLIALLFPMWYRKCSSTPYLTVFISVGTAYALLVSIWGFVAQNNEVILFCNPPLGLANEVSVFWSTSNIIINSLVVVVYVAIIIIVRSKAKGSASHETQRVVRRLSVTAVVFVFSWYMAILGVNLGYAVGLRDEALSLWQSFMVVFALLCFSQTFYVCLWRCAEYRIAFMEQLSIMTCHLINTKPKPSISTSSTTAKVVVQPKSKQ